MSKTKNILITYIPREQSLAEQTKEYRKIINAIEKFLLKKDFAFVIAEDDIINERLKKENSNELWYNILQ